MDSTNVISRINCWFQGREVSFQKEYNGISQEDGILVTLYSASVARVIVNMLGKEVECPVIAIGDNKDN